LRVTALVLPPRRQVVHYGRADRSHDSRTSDKNSGRCLGHSRHPGSRAGLRQPMGIAHCWT